MSRGYLQIVQLNSDCKNGKVYVYLAGGTVLAEIYDPVSGDEISNPLDIDSQGYVQAFHVDTETLYDIKAVDFLGATKLTRQNVSVIGGGTGAPGPQGIQGVKGDKGDKGDTGTAGRDGTDGTNGTDGTDGEDGVSLVSIRVDETSTTGRVIYNKSDDPENWIEAGDLVPSGLGKVKNSESDSLDFLPEKIVAGEGISVSLDETNHLEISAISMDDHKVQAHEYSTEANYAGSVLQAGAGIDISLTPDLNKLVIKATGTAVGGFYWKGAWDELTTYNSNSAVWYFDNTVTPVVNRLYIAMEPNQGINPIEDTSGIWSEMMRVDTLGDMFVAVDEDDVQTGYLIDKIREGSGIVITRHTDIGGNAYLALNSTCLYSVSIGGVTKHSTELGGGIQFTSEGGSTVAWDGNNVKISSVALGETSSTAYRGDRGKTAYDHSQTTGNPHGMDFSELENKPTTLAGYGITDAAERYHAFPIASTFGEATTSLYGHVRKAQYMTIDGNDVVPSSLMYQNVVQRFHQASGGAGTAGWLKVCSLTCVGGYTNEPITITLSRRGANKTCRLTMRFQSTNTLTPYVELANYEGQDYGVYYHKRVEGTYDIYVQKSEPYDRCNLTEFKSPYNIRLNSENGTVATVPTGSLAFSRAPSDYIKNGLVTTHDWNTLTDHGVYTVDNWSGANGPVVGNLSAYKWGQLVVEQYQDKVTQIYYPHQSHMAFVRQAWGSGAWQGWKTSAPTNYGTVDSSSNWNNFIATGKYRVTAVSGTNGPTTAYSLGILLVDYASDDYVQQTYIPTYGNGTPVCRQRRSGTWGGWYGSISGGTGMSLNTQIHYQQISASRTDPNAIYLCY